MASGEAVIVSASNNGYHIYLKKRHVLEKVRIITYEVYTIKYSF
jgi:hypothetical protein